MKPILEWLEEAKKQGYDWADAAIRNCDTDATTLMEEDLVEALASAFYWDISPEGEEFWFGVFESLSDTTPVTPTSLERLIENLEKLNKALENLEYNETLKEPYRTQVYEAIKASYEEQLAEVKAKTAGVLGIEPIKERKQIGLVVQDKDGSYCKYTAPGVAKDNRGWGITKWGGWSGITPQEAMALCGRLPKWSDDEPIPVYEK